MPAGSFSQRRPPSFHQDADNAGTHHAERAGRAEREIDHAALNEGATVIDPTLDRVSSIGDGDHASEGTSPVRAGHLAAMSPPAVIGGHSVFRQTWERRNRESHDRNDEPIHGHDPPTGMSNQQAPRRDKARFFQARCRGEPAR